MLKSLKVIATIVGATGLSITLSMSAHADVSDDPLLGSTNAIFLGGTAEPTPSTAYVEAADQLYLQPLGFADGASICDMAGNLPCDGSLQVLTTPEVFEFGPSSLQDETNLVYAIEAEYHAGLMSPSDPLTVFAYSQSAIAASAAEKVLAQDGIPQDDLHFVFIGDPSDANGIATNIYADLIQLFGGGTSGTTLTDNLLTAINEDQFAPGGLLAGYTPDDLYQTTIYTIDTDGVADWQEDWNAALAADNGNAFDALGSGIYHFFTTHVEYLGLTPAEVASGVATIDGLTTTITIPDGADAGTLINDTTALVDAFSHGIADSGAFTALLETVEDLFNPAYA
jgi:hypothetical protein